MSRSGQAKCSFTSDKLDWLLCISADSRVTDIAFRIAYVIALHAREGTWETWVSDLTIAEIIHRSMRSVVTARNNLRRAGWITWEHTRSSNLTTMLFDQVDQRLRWFDDARAVRKERSERKKPVRVVKNPSYLKSPAMKDSSQQGMKDSSYKHLRDNTLKKVDERTENHMTNRIEGDGATDWRTFPPSATDDDFTAFDEFDEALNDRANE